MKKVLIALLSVMVAVHAGAISASAVNTDKSIMQNDYLTLYVGQDAHDLGRYQLSAFKGNLENADDDSKNLMYENFYSSFTTIVVNGKACRFGEGEQVAAPYYDQEKNVCITVQKFGAIEVTQTLRFADGMQSGHDDMLLVTYSAKNTGDEEVLLGIRIMLDSQLDKDDQCTLKADNALLDFEKEYKGDIPQQWSVVSKNGKITAYGKILTVPDRIEFADWSSLFDKKWGYTVDSSKDIRDSAAALIWDNAPIAAGTAKEYSVYYGVKNKDSGNEPSEPSQTSEPSGSSETSRPAGSSVPADSSSPQTSKYSEISNPANNPVLTGEQSGLLAAAAAALLSSAAIFFGIKKRRKQ